MLVSYVRYQPFGLLIFVNLYRLPALCDWFYGAMVTTTKACCVIYIISSFLERVLCQTGSLCREFLHPQHYHIFLNQLVVVAMFKAIGGAKILSSSALRLLTARGRNSIIVLKRSSLSTTSSIRYGPEAPQNKLDEIFPLVDDFPSHHIGPRRIEAKAMLQELGYNVNFY